MAYKLHKKNQRKQKSTKKKFQRLEDITSVSLWERTFEGRKQTIFRKAKELELSCGVAV